MSEARQPGADFLARSAHKALHGDAAIEPRLPSLFEPAAKAWQDAPAEERDLPIHFENAIEFKKTAADTDPTGDVVAVDRPDGRVDPPRRLEQKNVGPVASRSDGPPVAIDTGPAARTATTARDAAPPEPAAIPTRDIAAPHHELAPPPNDPTRRRHGPPSLDRPQPARPPAVTALWQPSQPAPARREDSPSGSEGPRARPYSVEDGGRGVLNPVPVGIERTFDNLPPLAARASRSDRARGEPLAAAAAPVVNVTIGRVEVRAVSQAAARPRSDRPGPGPMSLDDYLEQRRSGR